MAKILIVDDEESVRQVLRIVLKGSGHEVLTAATEGEAREAFEGDQPDLVLQDMHMEDAQSGARLLKHYDTLRPEVPVIVITAHSDWDNTLEAMREGAYDFIKKPFDNEAIREVVSRAIAHRASVGDDERSDPRSPTEILGNSPAMRDILARIELVAPTDSTVLVTGESGTGKELVARALHYLSERKERPFVSINSGAFPDNLLENELFGHVGGAFSGALQAKQGLLEVAHTGTFFFDEVGDIPLEMQVKLLRVIEEQEFYPVGATQPKRVDVRFIGATNKDLFEEVEAGRFREDLYYRLNVIPIQLPPLRTRKDDIVLLASHFVAKFGRKMNREIQGISAAARARLIDYNWPGNIRELQNTIERSVALCRGERLEDVLIDRRRRGEVLPEVTSSAVSIVDSPVVQVGWEGLGAHEEGALLKLEVPEGGMDLDKSLADIERTLITAALDRTGGHLTNAAKLLGISFRSIRYKVQKLEIRDRSS